jgi:hypothetical protein
VPARASHLPSHFERSALQKLRSGGELPAAQLQPAGRSTLEKLLAKEWIERVADQKYRITSAGNDALSLELPIGGQPTSRFRNF